MLKSGATLKIDEVVMVVLACTFVTHKDGGDQWIYRDTIHDFCHEKSLFFYESAMKGGCIL
ncbi:hypothetical protein GGR08_000036 [Bartonella fuyuanensis]|uniref:Uncharacterized protein n=1 Tax=Bartonella fuyuanensis TaxID=1460968 RepID=A0A840DW18_9HYPH|nr:hypothetical protein [Bartonella fuyuanensis]MBB4075755.1 hypothetical protein [Bartonella fuyuanensis]